MSALFSADSQKSIRTLSDFINEIERQMTDRLYDLQSLLSEVEKHLDDVGVKIEMEVIDPQPAQPQN
jgi:hypothetical protein